MIASEYIKTFLPIQELDEVKPGEEGGIPEIGKDDLFLMSQMSTYAQPGQNAIMTSKKINYFNFSHKLSGDFDIYPMKLSIDGLSVNLRNLSSQTGGQISGLCTIIQQSACALSTYTNTICASLCGAVQEGYIAKYNTQTCCFTQFAEDVNNPTWLATSVTLSDGQIYNIERKSVSSLVVPDQWRIAFGGIAGDYFRTGTSAIVNNQSEIKYTVLSDSYVNCCISAWEDDSYGPLEVYVKSNINSTRPITILYETLNNPGGFSGKGFYNYYHFAIPVKSFPANNESDRTQIIVRYADNKAFKYNSLHRSYYTFSDYVFYAVPSKDDINRCVKKDKHFTIPPANTKNVYNFKFNQDGLITDATSVYYGPATSSLCGLIKIHDRDTFSHPSHSLRINADGYGYVNVPSATDNVYGVLKLSTGGCIEDTSSNIWCGLETTTDGHGRTKIPRAVPWRSGVIKLSGDMLKLLTDNGYININTEDLPGSYYGVGRDGSWHAHVKIPYAQYKDSISIPGVIRTGTPDTTRIRVARSVYVDDDGIAKVNVVTPLGVGMFNNTPNRIGDDTGYDLSVELQLNTSQTRYSGQLKDFRGHDVDANQYGSKVFQTTASINGFYMATLVYEGTNNTNNDSNAFLQIVCDDIVVTTIRPGLIKTGKNFTYSTYLGLFPGGDGESTNIRNFAAISNTPSFGSDKIYFLIREANNV